MIVLEISQMGEAFVQCYTYLKKEMHRNSLFTAMALNNNDYNPTSTTARTYGKSSVPSRPYMGSDFDSRANNANC